MWHEERRVFVPGLPRGLGTGAIAGLPLSHVEQNRKATRWRNGTPPSPAPGGRNPIPPHRTAPINYSLPPHRRLYVCCGRYRNGIPLAETRYPQRVPVRCGDQAAAIPPGCDRTPQTSAEYETRPPQSQGGLQLSASNRLQTGFS